SYIFESNMTNLEIIKKKIVPLEQLQRNLHVWRMKDLKIVFTNGCFDILHLGHIDYLSKASDLGDILIIGLNSDFSVKKLDKGKRPRVDSFRTSVCGSDYYFP